MKYSRKFAGTWLIASAFALACYPPPALAQQSIQDSSGNPFMEEVVDEEKVRREEEERKRASKINRRPLTPEELSNIGMQVNENGNLIPLINRGAPPVKRFGTQITTGFEPIYPYYAVPAYGPVYPGLGYPGYPGIGYPGIGYPRFGYPGIYPGYSPFGPFGFAGMSPFAMSPFGFPGIGNPYAYGYPGYFNVYRAPSYSYTFRTDSSSPDAPPPTTVKSGGTFLNRPFWSGYATKSPYGTAAGLNIGLPSTTQFESTTTFTPLSPSLRNPLPKTFDED